MTDEEIKAIAKEIAKQLTCHPPRCVVFDDETVSDINKFFKRLRSSANVAWFTAIGLIVSAIVAVLIAGVIARLKQLL